MQHLEFLAEPSDVGKRLDLYLCEHTDLSRSRVQRLIREMQVTIRGELVDKAALPVEEGMRIVLSVPDAAPSEAQPEDIPIEILYDDADLAVVVKPAGMVVHPAAGNPSGTLVNALLYRLGGLSGIGGEARPGIVHRLDKDTSGLLLVAKNDRAHLALSEQFKARTIEKHYRAIVFGQMREDNGRIDAPIARHPVDRKKMAVCEDGRPSATEWTVLERLDGACLLDVHLLTGRTHQIRVHMLSIGHPVLGDVIYAPNVRVRCPVPRLMLHAHRVAFTHPTTGVRLCFSAPMPEALEQLIGRLQKPSRG